MNEVANMDIPGIQRVWRLDVDPFDQSRMDESDNPGPSQYTRLLLGFMSETRLLTFSHSQDVEEKEEHAGRGKEEEEIWSNVEQVDLPPLTGPCTTWLLFPLALLPPSSLPSPFLQVTTEEARIVLVDEDNGSSKNLHAHTLNSWSRAFEGPDPITLAAHKGPIVGVIHQDGSHLSLLHVTQTQSSSSSSWTMQELANYTFDQQVSCLDMGIDNLVAVGLWNDFSIHILSIDSDGSIKPLLKCDHRKQLLFG